MFFMVLGAPGNLKLDLQLLEVLKSNGKHFNLPVPFTFC